MGMALPDRAGARWGEVMSETPRETLDQWLLSDGIGVAMLGAPIEVRQAIRVVLADRVVLANLAGRAQQRVLDLEAERDALRLACNVFAADLTEAGRLCGIADDEYPLRAVERVAAERDALLRSEERHLDLIDKLSPSGRQP